MTAENVIEQMKESLNGRPGQPIVFGVCNAMAERFDREPWVFRLLAIVLTLFWTVLAIAVYIILGLVLRETEHRTRQFFSGLAVITREAVEKCAHSLRGMCGEPGRDGSGYRGL